MKTLERKLPALFVIVLSSLLLARAAGAEGARSENQCVVDGKCPIVIVELDRAPMRIDTERSRQQLRETLERALAAEAAKRSAERAAAAELVPRG